MNVASYLFQSPYSSPVQVGRVDPSTKQEESKVQEASQKQQEVQSFAAPQGKELAPEFKAPKLLDTYV